MGLPKDNKILRYSSLVVGLLLIFGPFQNCSIYESEDRKDLNEKGFASSASCSPYMDVKKADEIFGTPTKVVFLQIDSGPLTCSVQVEGAPQTGNRRFTCSIAASNVDRAKTPSSDLTLIGNNSSTGPFFYYSYSRQDTETASGGPVVRTYIITVGAVEGHREGINCGAMFEGVPTTEEQDATVALGFKLVEAMANRAP